MTLIERILDTGDDDVVVVDNGAATFLPLCSYLIENGAIGLLTESGHAVRFHTVITGGQGYEDTVEGFEGLAEYFPGYQDCGLAEPLFREAAA